MTTDLEIRGEDAIPRGVRAGRSFDDLLGAAHTRYFATGYKRVRYGMHSGVTSAAEDASVTVDVSGAADYPVDWSVGSDGRPRQAHLSSVDALVLGVAAIERAVAEMPVACDAARLVIDHIALRSGARPHVELSDVPVRGTVAPRGSGIHADLRVGGFRIHARLRETDSMSGPSGPLRPYADGYVLHAVASELIEYSVRERAVLTRHTVRGPVPGGAGGIEATLWPGLTHIDHVVLFGQVAQVLAQVTAGVPRGSIDNLWMRRMAFTRTGSASPTQFHARAHILEHSVVERGGRALHSLWMEAASDHGVRAEAVFGFVTASR